MEEIRHSVSIHGEGFSLMKILDKVIQELFQSSNITRGVFLEAQNLKQNRIFFVGMFNVFDHVMHTPT